MTILELHNLLHRAGVGLEHRPEDMMGKLVEELGLDEYCEGNNKNRLRSAIETICEWFHIPQIPTDRIVKALFNPDTKLLAELRRDSADSFLKSSVVRAEAGQGHV